MYEEEKIYFIYNNLCTTINIIILSKTVQFEFPLLHLKYRCLNDPKPGAFLTSSGRVFHILCPEYANDFLYISRFGFGTYRVNI